MRLLPLAALLLLCFTLTYAVPLPAQDESSSWASEESAEQKHFNLESNVDSVEEIGAVDRESDESQFGDKLLKKRSPDAIPDVDLCNHYQHAKDSYEVKSEDAYERYYHIEKPLNSEVRRKRQPVDDNSSSQENSSEEKGKLGAAGASEGEGAKGADGARRKRKADDSSSEENSSEEKGKPGAAGASEGEGAKGADGARRKRKVDKNTVSVETDSVVYGLDSEENREYNEVSELKKDSSLEDYVQGCEVMDVDSDEANETTYFEDRRKRSVESKESAELVKSAAVDSEQSNKDDASEASDEKQEDGSESSEVSDINALILERRRRAVISSEEAVKVSAKKGEKDAEKSKSCGCGKSKRAIENTNESKSNEDSKQSEKKSAGCGCSAKPKNSEQA